MAVQRAIFIFVGQWWAKDEDGRPEPARREPSSPAARKPRKALPPHPTNSVRPGQPNSTVSGLVGMSRHANSRRRRLRSQIFVSQERGSRTARGDARQWVRWEGDCLAEDRPGAHESCKFTDEEATGCLEPTCSVGRTNLARRRVNASESPTAHFSRQAFSAAAGIAYAIDGRSPCWPDVDVFVARRLAPNRIEDRTRRATISAARPLRWGFCSTAHSERPR